MRPATRTGRVLWVLVLAGPVIWYTHFWVVYLLAEAICDAGGYDTRWLGLAPLSFLTLAATGLAATATLWFAKRAWRLYRHPDAEFLAEVVESRQALAFIGVLLGALFFVSILFVGVPALFLRPC